VRLFVVASIIAPAGVVMIMPAMPPTVITVPIKPLSSHGPAKIRPRTDQCPLHVSHKEVQEKSAAMACGLAPEFFSTRPASSHSIWM